MGFALLPFVWAVNAVWFFSDAFRKPPFNEQRQIKTCKSKSWSDLPVFGLVSDVVCSGLGALLWLMGLGVWVVAFQVNRARWGALADELSFIIPLGMP